MRRERKRKKGRMRAKDRGGLREERREIGEEKKGGKGGRRER